MSDLSPPTLCLNAAPIIAALFSPDPASPGRRLFKMSEVGLIRLSATERVIGETQGVLRGLTGEAYDTVKVLLAETLVLANVVIAAKVDPDCEVLVTDDRQPPRTGYETESPDRQAAVMTGAEALDWAVAKVQIRARLGLEAKRAKRL